MDLYEGKLIKVAVLGNQMCGKTSLMLRFSDDCFVETTGSVSQQVDFKLNSFDINGERIKLQVWDTALQDRFNSLCRSYFRVNGYLIMFDLTDLESFNDVKKWVDMVERYAPENTKMILVGTKADLIESRCDLLDYDSVAEMAKYYGMEYFETSAKTGKNVDAAFHRLTSIILDKCKTEKPPVTGLASKSNINLMNDKPPATVKSSSCCN